MPFDPNIPVNNTLNDADPIRANLNILNARCDALANQNTASNQRIDQNEADDAATNARCDNLDAGVAAANGRIDQNEASDAATNQRIDNLPPPQPPFPYTGDADINGTIRSTGSIFAQGDLGVGITDPGHSGEAGVRIASVNNGDGPIPRLAGRTGGMDQYNFGLDGAGITGNMGTPSVQHGDLLAYDGMTTNYRPTRGITQDVTLSDGTGGFITLHIQSGLITSVTGP